MPVTAWDPTPYPDPRPNRKTLGEDPAAALTTVANPRVRRMVFHIQSAALAQQRTAVSPRINGPALIKRIEYTFTASNSVPNQGGIHLIVSPDGGGAGAVAFPGPLPTGVSIYETTFATGGAQVEALRDMNYLDHAATARGPWTHLIDEFFSGSECFLKLVWTNPGAASQVVDAIVLVYENVDPDLVLDLLG